MKRSMTISLVLTLSVLVSLVSLPAAAQGPQQRRCFASETGVITLGQNQKLRVTAVGTDGNDTIRIRFRRIQYMAEGCNSDGVCRYTVASQSTSAPITLMLGEAASMDITPMLGSSGVRAVILSNRRNVRATATIINTITGEPTSTSVLDTMEDEECGL